MPLPKKNLLICFDAFGTLFKPKRPVAQQYAEAATSLGLRSFTEEEVATSFRAAFKNESKQNPNYGKASGMNPEKWWTNIIHNTFQPLIGKHQELPAGFSQKLFQRFSSSEGYELLPSARELLQHLRKARPTYLDRVVVGVITNSDDRVPAILSSLGLRVSPLRHGAQPSSHQQAAKREYDIDFTIMSYDVGYEKPDLRIFQAAEQLLDVTLRFENDSLSTTDRQSWEKIYVGDEFEKDVVGARNAGWYAILVGENGAPHELPPMLSNLAEVSVISDMRELERWLMQAIWAGHFTTHRGKLR